MVMTKTAVFWDIGSCPVPYGYDPCLVGPVIKSELKRSGISGPITITALGKLKLIPTDVLKSLSSSGIALRNVSQGLGGIVACLLVWKFRNTAPANLMVISNLKLEPDVEVEPHIFKNLVSELSLKGNRLLWAYPCVPSEPSCFSAVVSKTWLWTSLLEAPVDDSDHELVVSKDKCVLSRPWYCSVCHVECHSFEDFTTHLKSEQHDKRELHFLGLIEHQQTNV
ncbi:uncharacterized protein LOC17878820 [Capsella rubella]|uniref:uncharacterized protein LOC17878820 n=1 Tax=Capsella rubella TaxID=81985 RepID=UPI000CD50B12|nr:uncharacterized protein LOC17878820 [Capsella rubella]